MRSVFGLANKDNIVSSKESKLSEILFLCTDSEKINICFLALETVYVILKSYVKITCICL